MAVPEVRQASGAAIPQGDNATRVQGVELNPYVGPRPFETHERQLFFGRDWEAEELVALIVAHPAVLFYAQSGAGKSSLLNARIVPKLRDEEGCEVLPVARVRGDIPAGVRAEQIENLYAFNALLNWTEETEVSPAELVNLSLARFLSLLPHQSDNEGYPALRIIIFDQFEELFTFYPERWPEREKFLSQVNEALADDSLLRVLFVIREDYLAQLDPYLHLLPEQLRYRFRLERLRQEAALAAVVGPLRGTERFFAPGVAEALVAELLKIRVEGRTGEVVEAKGEVVEPVQLQVVCQSLWADLPPEVMEITQSQLLAFGNVDQALTRFYERAVKNTVQQTKTFVKSGGEYARIDTGAASATPYQGIVPFWRNLSQKLVWATPLQSSLFTEWSLRNWFERELMTPAGTRGLVYRGAKTTGGIPNVAVDTLESHHLIRGEQRAGARWYELTHDRFILPIQKSNASWRAVLLKRGGIAIASLASLIFAVLLTATWGVRSFDPTGLIATATANRIAAYVTATAATQREATARAAENEAAQVISEATADIAQVTVVAASAQQATAEMAAVAVDNSLPTNVDALPADASTAIAATQVAATVVAATQQAAKAEATAAAVLALLARVDATTTAIAAEGVSDTEILSIQETARANATAVAVAATATGLAIEAQTTATANAANAATAAADSATATAAALPTPTPTATASPTPTPELTPTLTPVPTPKPAISWPPRDWIVFTSARLSPADLYLINGDGSNVVRLTANIGYDPDYSPGSNRLVFATTREKRAVLFTINPDGTEEQNVGGYDWDNWEPTFAPDGRRIAFVSSRDGGADIYSMTVEGSNVRRLTDDPAKDYAPAWSPDGRRIVFVSERSGQADIWLMDSSGGNLVQLTDNRAQDVNPAWSPDGVHIVFASDRDGNADIFVMDANGDNQRNLTRSPFPENYPAWSPNGNWLTFSRFTVNNEIFIMTVDSKCPADLPASEVVETTPDGNCMVNLTKSSDADWSPIWLPRSVFSQ